MNRRSSMLQIMALSLSLVGISRAGGQTEIALSGTVVDDSGKPVAGVVVGIADGELSDTTRVDGNWLLRGWTTSVGTNRRPRKLHWSGSALILDLEAPALVGTELFGASGRRLATTPLRMFQSGSQVVPLASPPASGVRWLRVRIGESVMVIPANGNPSNPDVGIPGVLARTASNDRSPQLVYSFKGQTVREDSLASMTQSGILSRLRKHSVSGHLSHDPRVQIDSVWMWLWDSSARTPRKSNLSIDTMNNGYSGFAYTLEPMDAPETVLSAWIQVRGNRNHVTAISDTMKFVSRSERLDSFSVFSDGNALPDGRILAPDSVEANVPTRFSFQLDNQGAANHHLGERIAHVEWDFGEGSGWTNNSDPTEIVTQLTVFGLNTLKARVTDEDSNTIVVSKPVQVYGRRPILHISGPTGKTTTPGDTSTFSLGIRYAPRGLREVIWNFGDGTSPETTKTQIGDHVVKHVYSLIGGLPTDSSKSYPLRVSIVDTLGGTEDFDAITTIVVVNDLPVLTGLRDTFGFADSTIHLLASGKDRGRIVGFEWSLDGRTFQPGRADTSFKLPGKSTSDFHVHVRAIDEDGNVSKTDTVLILVYDLITDPRDGQTYRTMEIGKQTWMGQNLNFRSDSSWWYENSPDSGAKYGRLYNWAGAYALSDSCLTNYCADQIRDLHQGVCPAAWHIPSVAEWSQLIDFVEADPRVGIGNSAVALKSKTMWKWNRNGKDLFGFAALPAGDGMRNFFVNSGSGVFWWTNDEQQGFPSMVKFRHFCLDSESFRQESGEKNLGLSIRCLKNRI